MSIVAKSNHLSKAKVGGGRKSRPGDSQAVAAGGAKRPRRLKDRRLAAVPVASLHTKPCRALLAQAEADGWRLTTDRGQVHLQGLGGMPGATKTCRTVELWEVPADDRDRATQWIREVRFVEPDEAVTVAVQVVPDGGSWLTTWPAGSGIRPGARIRVRIHDGIGQALLSLFPGVAGEPWQAPLQALLAEAEAFHERAVSVLSRLPENCPELVTIPDWLFAIFERDWEQRHAQAKAGQAGGDRRAAAVATSAPTRRTELTLFLSTLFHQASEEQLAALIRNVCGLLKVDVPACAAKAAAAVA